MTAGRHGDGHYVCGGNGGGEKERENRDMQIDKDRTSEARKKRFIARESPDTERPHPTNLPSGIRVEIFLRLIEHVSCEFDLLDSIDQVVQDIAHVESDIRMHKLRLLIGQQLDHQSKLLWHASPTGGRRS